MGAETTVEEKNLESFPFTVASFYSCMRRVLVFVPRTYTSVAL